MCEWVEETDSDGNSLKTKKYDGRYYVSIFLGNVKDHLADIENMDVREDDIFILSYPKSGTHWVFAIANMLRSGTSAYLGTPYFLDFNDVDFLNQLPSPRILATHMTFDRMPRQLREGRGKALAIFRNAKDTAVSFHIFLSKLKKPDFIGSWEGFLKFYAEGKVVYGSWFESLFEWEKTKETHKGDNIMYLIYEDMKQNLFSNVEKMASFLGVTYERQFLDEVTDRCTFKTMVKTIMSEIKPQEQEFVKDATDDHTLPIYRKGEVGDWKNHFTVAQNEYFDRIYEEKMAKSKSKFRYE